ncbi:hypothetical protein SLS56_011447 [Neofusicoccum ribis]|uniref:Uncharacterized protein n=1 Tax=Neofusicoccum ribis TaxID=45134 RepID=A0ABR3SBK3_9PEZI
MASSSEGGENTIRFVPTVAHWRVHDDAVRILGHKHPNLAYQLALHICLSTSKALASIRLRVPVGFKELPRKTNTFIIVYPERIESLEVFQPDGHDTTGSLPTTVRRILVQQQKCSGDEDIVLLRVRLTQPSALLLPSLQSFAPLSTSSAGALQLTQSLAASSLLDLYLPFSDTCTKTLHALRVSAVSGLKFMASDLNMC